MSAILDRLSAALPLALTYGTHPPFPPLPLSYETHAVLERLSAATGVQIAHDIHQLRAPLASPYSYARKTVEEMESGDGVGTGGKGKKLGMNPSSMYSMYLPTATFRVLPHSTRAKPLICLDPGAATAPYVTVLLRGASKAPKSGGGAQHGRWSGREGREGDFPSKVKNVVLYAVYAAATMSTEAALLADLGATVSSPPSLYPDPRSAGSTLDERGGDRSAFAERGEEGDLIGAAEGDCRLGGARHTIPCDQEVAEWKLLGLSPWISHALPPEVSRNLSRSFFKCAYLTQQSACPADEPGDEAPASASKYGQGNQREKRVWALGPTGMTDWRNHNHHRKARRLSRVREHDVVSTSLHRPPCPHRGGKFEQEQDTHARAHTQEQDASTGLGAGLLSEGQGQQASLAQAQDKLAGSGDGKDSATFGAGNARLQHPRGRCVWALPGCSVDDLGADGLRVLVSST